MNIIIIMFMALRNKSEKLIHASVPLRSSHLVAPLCRSGANLWLSQFVSAPPHYTRSPSIRSHEQTKPPAFVIIHRRVVLSYALHDVVALVLAIFLTLSKSSRHRHHPIPRPHSTLRCASKSIPELPVTSLRWGPTSKSHTHSHHVDATPFLHQQLFLHCGVIFVSDHTDVGLFLVYEGTATNIQTTDIFSSPYADFWAKFCILSLRSFCFVLTLSTEQNHMHTPTVMDGTHRLHVLDLTKEWITKCGNMMLPCCLIHSFVRSSRIIRCDAFLLYT